MATEMTRKEMITACVEEQIARGIIKAEDKAFHVTGLLDGNCYIKAKSEAECERWHNAVFDKQRKTLQIKMISMEVSQQRKESEKW